MRNPSIAMEIRERVLPSRDHFWRPEDFDASPDAVTKTLSRLSAAGELSRIRRGLYWRGAPTRLGMAPPTPERLTDEVLGDAGTGPSGWSAALALGLSTQVPRRETISVPGRAPRTPDTIRFVSRAASTKRRDERLRPAEVALFEVLRDWDGLVDISTHDALDRVAHLIDSGALRPDRLVRASATEPPRVRERLRRLLTALGLGASAVAVRRARSQSVSPDLALAG
jgi:Family of unknown function (DUF6088)